MVCMLVFSCVQLSATLWTVVHQAPMFMGFSRQECSSGLPFLPQRDLPNPRIEPMSPVSPLAGRFFTTEPAEKPQNGMKVKMLVAQSIQLFATLWTIAHQAPLSIEFSRQKYWNG